ncbi:MAG: SMP-30/gluconolactonase/LRE family protein [Acidobacteria bacterium]|nr:SMP-30/gluconolactonase/LRE family protein [Acidobacteriota bacterium]
MKLINRRRFVGVGLGATMALAGTAQDSQAPVEFARSEEFSEGPVFDYEGNFFFTHGRLVTRVAPNGSSAVWAATSGANGHKILPDGNHLLCVTGDRAIVLFDPTGKVIRPASTECDGAPLRAPNDLTLDQHGGFYFTDPGGSRDKPIGTVHYVDSSGVTHLVASGMWVPNGLVLSQDGRTLFVAETLPNRVVKFAVDGQGKLGALEEFAQLPFREGHQPEPDGMALDTNGNLYVAHLGTSTVKVLAPDGSPLRTLPAGNYDASNLVFGGTDLNELYITGSTGHRSNTPGRVYRLNLADVTGVSSLRPR